MALRPLEHEGYRIVNITGRKDLTEERRRAREVIDRVYVPRINETMGPKFSLYQAKAQNGLFLVESQNELDDVQKRFGSLLTAVALVENERQAVQGLVDNAKSSAEIDKIIEGITQ